MSKPSAKKRAEEVSVHGSRKNANRVIVVLVVAVFGVLLLWKVTSGGTPPAPRNDAGNASITSVHNDAVTDYEAALDSGKPIYVLFHSLTCQPCVEISAVADSVVPEYGGEVTFVNAITDDQTGQELARRFTFQYIPTSFFLAPDGTVIDSFVGSMTEDELRGRLDALLSKG